MLPRDWALVSAYLELFRRRESIASERTELVGATRGVPVLACARARGGAVLNRTPRFEKKALSRKNIVTPWGTPTASSGLGDKGGPTDRGRVYVADVAISRVRQDRKACRIAQRINFANTLDTRPSSICAVYLFVNCGQAIPGQKINRANGTRH